MVGEGVESRVPYYSVFTAPDREVLPKATGGRGERN